MAKRKQSFKRLELTGLWAWSILISIFLSGCLGSTEPATEFVSDAHDTHLLARLKLKQYVESEIEPWLFATPPQPPRWADDLRLELTFSRRLFADPLNRQFIDMQAMDEACRLRKADSTLLQIVERFLQKNQPSRHIQNGPNVPLFAPLLQVEFPAAQNVIPSLETDLTRARGFLAKPLLEIQMQLEADLPEELKQGLTKMAAVRGAIRDAADAVELGADPLQTALKVWINRAFDLIDEFQEKNIRQLGRLLDLTTRYGSADFLKPEYLGRLQSKLGGIAFALDVGVIWGSTPFERLKRSEIVFERDTYTSLIEAYLLIDQQKLQDIVAQYPTPDHWCARGYGVWLSQAARPIAEELEAARAQWQQRALSHFATLSWLRLL